MNIFTQRRHSEGISRREFLRVGFCAGVGVTLADLLKQRAEQRSNNQRSVVNIFLGGQSETEVLHEKARMLDAEVAQSARIGDFRQDSEIRSIQRILNKLIRDLRAALAAKPRTRFVLFGGHRPHVIFREHRDDETDSDEMNMESSVAIAPSLNPRFHFQGIRSCNHESMGSCLLMAS